MEQAGGQAAVSNAGEREPIAAAGERQQPAASASGREEHLRMLQEYRASWQSEGGLLQRSARRLHKLLWWLMCFTGLDVLDYHERVLFSLGYIALLVLVLAGACKQVHALVELWRGVVRQRVHVNGG